LYLNRKFFAIYAGWSATNPSGIRSYQFVDLQFDDMVTDDDIEQMQEDFAFVVNEKRKENRV